MANWVLASSTNPTQITGLLVKSMLEDNRHTEWATKLIYAGKLVEHLITHAVLAYVQS
jgi:hypothetical protein